MLLVPDLLLYELTNVLRYVKKFTENDVLLFEKTKKIKNVKLLGDYRG